MTARRSNLSLATVVFLVIGGTVYWNHSLNIFVDRIEEVIKDSASENNVEKHSNVIEESLQHETYFDSNPMAESNLIPDLATLEKMSLVELITFFHGYIQSTQVTCNRRLRMGRVQDGGWDICYDPRFKIDPNNCLVYSFGIHNDFSFDDAMEEYGCEVHSFDPSMEDEDHVRGQKVHFHKVGIGEKNSQNPGGWALYTLGTLREKYGHQPTKRRMDLLKMDVEGAELLSLLKAVEEGSLRDAYQLSFEMHVYTPRSKGNGDPTKKYLVSMLSLLRLLWQQGFRLYHTNRNSIPSLVYRSRLDKKLRTICHELYFVNEINR